MKEENKEEEKGFRDIAKNGVPCCSGVSKTGRSLIAKNLSPITIMVLLVKRKVQVRIMNIKVWQYLIIIL